MISKKTMMERFIINISTVTHNQLCLETDLFSMVKENVQETMSEDFNFSMPVGYNNIFQLTTDFSLFINRKLEIL